MASNKSRNKGKKNSKKQENVENVNPIPEKKENQKEVVETVKETVEPAPEQEKECTEKKEECTEKKCCCCPCCCRYHCAGCAFLRLIFLTIILSIGFAFYLIIRDDPSVTVELCTKDARACFSNAITAIKPYTNPYKLIDYLREHGYVN